jgi:putative N-acetyltransferase (TIGR04045 family)
MSALAEIGTALTGARLDAAWRMPSDIGSTLTGAAPAARGFMVRGAELAADLDAYRRLRAATFVDEQGLFASTDADDWDDHPATRVLVAVDPDGTVVGGVRLTPADPARDLAWWHGSRLAVAGSARGTAGVGAALVRAACATAEGLGALRFEATVQPGRLAFFRRLGWEHLDDVSLCGVEHHRVRWPIGRVAAQVRATKAALGALLDGVGAGGAGWVGDDAAPVPGSDVLAACDAIVPAMVDRDPWWAGWCGVLVNVNDVTVKGATPVGILDAIGARTESHAHRIMGGLRAAAAAWGVPILGGHTTLGVPGSLAVTALGRTAEPVPAGGGRPGDDVVVAADLGGRWRPGYLGRQWDSTTARTPEHLRAQARLVGDWRPDAAKDVSMAGLVGTLGMLAEASGTGAELDLAAAPTPTSAATADWLSCFPGFAVVAAQRAGRPLPGAAGGTITSSRCGRLVAGRGVHIVWPDGERIRVLDGPVTGLGTA